MPRGHSAVPAWCGPERFSPIDNSRHSASQPSWLYHTHVCWRREQDETAFLARLPGNVDYETVSHIQHHQTLLAFGTGRCLGRVAVVQRLYSGTAQFLSSPPSAPHLYLIHLPAHTLHRQPPDTAGAAGDA